MTYKLAIIRDGILDELPNGDIGDYLQIDLNGFRWAGGIAHPPLSVADGNPVVSLESGQHLVIDFWAEGSFDGELNATSIMGALHELGRLVHVPAVTQETMPEALVMSPVVLMDKIGNVWYRDWSGTVMQISSGPMAVVAQSRNASGDFSETQAMVFSRIASQVGGWTVGNERLIVPEMGHFAVTIRASIARSEGTEGTDVEVFFLHGDEKLSLKRQSIIEFGRNPFVVTAATIIGLNANEPVGVSIGASDESSYFATVEMELRRM